MAETSVNTATSLTRPMRTTSAVIAAISWFALVLQLLLMVQQAAPGTSLHAVVNYFSFFTILTNLLVALGTTLPLLASHSVAGQFFLRPSSQTAIAVYITIVGVTYSLLLRQLWNPQGAQKVADVLLHDVVPVLYVAFWVFLVPKFTLRWSDAVRWLAFPVALHGLYPGTRICLPLVPVLLHRCRYHRIVARSDPRGGTAARILRPGSVVHRHWPMDRPVFPATRSCHLEPQSHPVGSV